ncbi:MAG: hemin transporter [Nitrospirae bacterium RBG_19FT_COMBO_58_9]|nr:MAG: hemin transporter [Nitrospirae bacterium RBG_19FT_COMBO_58_9]
MPKQSLLWGGVTGFGFAMVLASCVATEQMPTGRPLYVRLGGKLVLSVVVEQFVVNVVVDTRINGRFATADIRKLKTALLDQVCMVAGGPCTYSGRDMKTTHAGMKISNGDFEALVEDLVKALDTLNVPAQEKRELLGLLGPMRKDIVEDPSRS